VPGSIAHADVAGPSRWRFDGRVGRVRLVIGRYKLTATPTDSAGNVGSPLATRFRIANRLRRRR